MAEIGERQAAAETKIDALWKCVFGNGQPGLEAKFMGAVGSLSGEFKQHVESVERHANKNMQEGDGLVLHAVGEETKAREKQHEENKIEQKELGKKVDRLSLIVAGMNGALVLFKILEDAGVIHIGGQVAH